MGIFKPSIDKQLAAAIDARDRLTSRLADSETNIADLAAEAERCALDNLPDAELDKVEGRMRAASDRAQTLRSALAKATVEVNRLEQARADAADKARREEVASSLELVAREVVESAEAVRAAVDRLYVVMAKAATIAPEAAGLATFAEMARVEIPSGAELIARLVRQNREQVLSGGAPPRMPVVPEPYIQPSAPGRELTAMLFALRPIKWRDEFGKQRMGGKFQDVEVPQRLAARALQSGAVVSLDNPLRRQHGSQGGPVPHASSAFDLDAEASPEPEHVAEPPIVHSEFERVDRGPPFVLKLAR
ncbi:hypothetical protein [Bradyrhizobium erythrophlei]|uniref:Uncharacterized protein n=1 Tax=Bradyrhizobium erythrophlei TaxID=1437360 RepID=A0A1M5S1D3_9BRAD|nr:hypothetical protein [Bradyrhizobium erythrophlei]SHH32290.1 hypothetical protein SAMN05444169_6888 [Bradyrhizobium erythrophlei]